MNEKLATLTTKLKEITHIHGAAEVLGWDQQVYMPAGGAEARAEQLATLERMAHELFVKDEIGQLLEDLSGADFPYDSHEAALVRVTRHDYERARKLSPELVAEASRTFSLGQQVWTQARAEKDFAQFEEILTKIIDTNIRMAEAYGYDDVPYDALLEEFEPGMKTAEVRQVFAELKEALVPIVQAISERADMVDDAIFKQKYEHDKQWKFGMQVLEDIGFDLERGRQDESPHPFTTSFSVNDVRITTRISEQTFPSGFFGTLHEAGHGMYEQNISASLDGTPVAGGTSLGVHESQSRLWENVIGRGQHFWNYFYPRLQFLFPEQLGRVSEESFYQAINRVEPSLIRVEADEVTYNLHIFLRFELEQDLINQTLKVADLPDAWNAKMESYLGLTPPDDAVGVLQDIHWSGGLMGYFPTYALGNILSVQFYEQILCDIPSLPEQIENGEFNELRNWLTYRILKHGKKFTTNELLKRATGDDKLDAEPYLMYIKHKFGNIYDLPEQSQGANHSVMMGSGYVQTNL